jgi:hypothetical protein
MNVRVFTGLGASMLFACLSLVLCPQQAAAQNPHDGATYITTVADSTGAFASRGAITFHADHTLSVIDSGQGGPTFFFTSQQGTWGVSNKRMLVGRTIDFDFPPSADVASLDYTFTFGPNGTISGTIALCTFPLITGNPNNSCSSPLMFSFTGYAITLP